MGLQIVMDSGFYWRNGGSNMKTWEIFHYTYGDICGDSWYGKRGSHRTIGFITDTEDNIKTLVNKLNENNRSYYAKNEPEDEFDNDYCDEDYISYAELRVSTVKEIESKYIR